MRLIGAHILGIQLVFQEFGDFQVQTFQSVGRKFQILAACLAWKRVHSGAEQRVFGLPVDVRKRLGAQLDQLVDIAPQQAQPLLEHLQPIAFLTHLLRQRFDFGGAGNQRGNVEAERLAAVCALPCPFSARKPGLARKALAVRAVLPENQPRLHQRAQMPAQRRRRHAIGPQGQLGIGRKHHQAIRLGELRLADRRSAAHSAPPKRGPICRACPAPR